jgi:TRAP-type C4-dicarboxylate transport system permease small subunit
MTLARFERAALLAARILAAAGLLLLLGLAATRLADGLMRSLAGAPIVAVDDLGGLVSAIAVASCFPIALMERSNISIRFVEALFGIKWSQLFDALAAVLASTAMALIAWQFFLYAGKEAKAGDMTWMLGIQVAPFWYIVDAIFWCAAAVQLIVTIHLIGLFMVRVPL